MTQLNSEQKESFFKSFAITIKNYFPQLGIWLLNVKDPRYTAKATYHRSIMFWTAIFLFLLKLQSSRNINYQLNQSEQFLTNFQALFPLLHVKEYQHQERLPDYGAVIDMLKKVSPEQLEKVQVKMVKNMIQKRALENSRLLEKYYLAAIDGTQMLTFKQRHCPHCLRKKIGTDDSGQPIYLYYHYVLVIMLVTPNKLAIPILWEFVENQSQDVTKQDCELKAFHRLLPRFKAYFPRTHFCLLLDSLYANEPVFRTIKSYQWEYIIRFKKGSMPAFHQEYQDYLPFYEQNRGTYRTKRDNCQIDQRFQWVNDIQYANHKLHVLECFETEVASKGKIKKKHFLWISSIRVTHQNYDRLANQGGRCRWKIENQGFKAQKKEGYQLEHAYSLDYNAIKCFYAFLQIAHTICQVIEKGGLIKDILKCFGSKQNFYKKFLSAYTEHRIDEGLLQKIMTTSFQIRLDSS